MRTPSLSRRVVAVGVGVVAVLALGLDALLYLSVRSVAADRTRAALDNQAALANAAVRAEGPEPSATALVGRLSELEVNATVRVGDGPVLRTGVTGTAGLATRELDIAPGTLVRVFAPSPDADPNLRRLLLYELAVTPMVIVLAAVLLRMVAEVAMRPVEEIAAAARRTASGRRGERLRPDRPDTRLGQIALTYDTMLDALEGALAEARAAERESARLEERTRRVLETAGEAFMVAGHDGAVVEWNAEAERLLGWTRDEVLGRDLEGTVLAAGQAAARLTAVEHFAAPGDRSTYRSRGLEVVAVHRDGRRFPAEVTVWVTTDDGVPTYNALLRDLTEQKRAEEATTRLATIVEAIDRAILSTDLDGTVLTWNPGAERVYGFTGAEAIGRSVASLIVPEDWREAHVRCLQAAARDEVVNAEVVRRRKDGKCIDVALSVSPLRDATGAVHGASSLEKDVTEERLIASRLAASSAAQEAALAEARRSEASTRRFLDDAAHQLRTPITSIRAGAETMQRNVTPEQREKLLAAIVRDSERAGRLMAGLLRMARLDHAEPLRPRPTDLVALCHGEAEQARLESPNLEIVVRTADRLPAGVPEIDGDAVAEILSNLVDNARRHARARIDLVVRERGGQVVMEVVDDGPGLPEGHTELAFERFVSLDARGGSGLGLSIARQLARAHGGDLTYRTGAFVLELPWRPGTGPEQGGDARGDAGLPDPSDGAPVPPAGAGPGDTAVRAGVAGGAGTRSHPPGKARLPGGTRR